MRLFTGLAMFMAGASVAVAADMEAGKAKAAAVCAACHGAQGVSVADGIPNLAGQKSRYLETQLGAFKDGSRKNALMSAMAAQLSADDIANLAAHFAAQQGAAAGTAKSEQLPNVAKSSVRFPEMYKTTFTKYYTNNFPDAKQVRFYYANDAAAQAAKAGKPLPDGALLIGEINSAKLDADKKPVTGSDGFFVPDQIVGYIAMERAAGWGKDIPDMLRNEEWNYAAFTGAKERRPGINQAECLACHKPLDKASYTFTLDKLTAAAKAQ